MSLGGFGVSIGGGDGFLGQRVFQMHPTVLRDIKNVSLMAYCSLFEHDMT